MAKQESIGAPAPLDVEYPYWLPNSNGSRSSQPEPEFQFPSNYSQIEQVRAPAEKIAILTGTESTGAPAPSNPGGRRGSSQSQDPLHDSQIEARPHSDGRANSAAPFTETQTVLSEAEVGAAETQTVLSEAEAIAKELRTTPGLLNSYLPLYNAAKSGDWKTARSLVGDNRNLWTARITIMAETALMVAARSFKWRFVEKLVEILSPEEIAMQSAAGNTVLHWVALTGSVKTAEILVRKCSELKQITSNGETPLLSSLSLPHKEMVWYLTLVTRPQFNSPSCPFTSTHSAALFEGLSLSGYNDITIYILQRYRDHIGYPENENGHLILWLSTRPSNFFNKRNFTFMERWLYKFIQVEIGVPPHSLRNKEAVSALTTSIPSRRFVSQVLHRLKMLLWKAIEKLVPSFKKVREAKLQHTCAKQLVEHFCKILGKERSFQQVADLLKIVMYNATTSGVVEIVRICLEQFPDLILDLIFKPVADKDQNILQLAIKYRQNEIFNLITKMPVISSILAVAMDESGNTVLHLSAKMAPSSQLLSVSGVALQMQRELQWFKEVEKISNPYQKSVTNKEGKTAMDVFIEEHKKLAEEGEKWMKDTANSCMIVTTLVATVVFAAAFTVPGGNVGETGVPIFLRRNDFLVFVISDALALFSSSTSLLMFLSILTARYAPEDFLLKLPRRLIIGLGSLFFAIINMMVAFGATLFMVLREKWRSVYIPIIILGCIPVLIFAKQQVPLLYDMVQSTYGSGVFRKKKK